MFKTGTAVKSAPSRGLFRDFDGIEPADSLFRSDGPDRAGRTERCHVSASDDPEELRAERTADRVMGGGSIFRETDGPEAGGGDVELPSADLAGPGSALPAGLQQSMGASMGADFSGVRVHTGAGADRASRRLSARAFARGRDLYFRDGEYDPGSREGQHLIAHELAHVADGADGLHRVVDYKAQFNSVFGQAGNAMKQTLEDCTNEMKNDATLEPARVKELTEKYKAGDITLAEMGNEKEQVNKTYKAVRYAIKYKDQLETYLNTANEDKKKELADVSKQLNELCAKYDLHELKTCRDLVNKTDSDNRKDAAGLSEMVLKLISHPHAEEFMNAASKISGTSIEGFDAAEEQAAGKAALAGKFKKDVPKETDHAANTSTAGEMFGDIGDIGSGITESSMKRPGSDATKSSEVGGLVAGAAGIVGSTLGTIGASMSAEQSRRKSNAQKETSENAKKRMQLLAKQLAATAQTPQSVGQANPQPGGQTTDRDTAVKGLCDRINATDRDGFAGDGNSSLAAAIDNVLGGTLTPPLTDRQKKLLSTLKVMEASRKNREGDSDRELKKWRFGFADAVAQAAKFAGGAISFGNNVAEVVNSSDSYAVSIIGSVISVLGSAVGLGSSIWQKAIGDDLEEPSEADQQKEKFAACRSAVQMIAGAGAARPNLLEDLKKKRTPTSNGVPSPKISNNDIKIAERYASALFVLEAANVEVADFVKAVDGGFGAAAGGGPRSGADRLNDMYASLRF